MKIDIQHERMLSTSDELENRFIELLYREAVHRNANDLTTSRRRPDARWHRYAGAAHLTDLFARKKHTARLASGLGVHLKTGFSNRYVFARTLVNIKRLRASSGTAAILLPDFSRRCQFLHGVCPVFRDIDPTKSPAG